MVKFDQLPQNTETVEFGFNEFANVINVLIQLVIKLTSLKVYFESVGTVALV